MIPSVRWQAVKTRSDNSPLSFSLAYKHTLTDYVYLNSSFTDCRSHSVPVYLSLSMSNDLSLLSFWPVFCLPSLLDLIPASLPVSSPHLYISPLFDLSSSLPVSLSTRLSSSHFSNLSLRSPGSLPVSFSPSSQFNSTCLFLPTSVPRFPSICRLSLPLFLSLSFLLCLSVSHCLSSSLHCKPE